MAGPRLRAERIPRSVSAIPIVVPRFADGAEDSGPQRCRSRVDSIGSRGVIIPAGCDLHAFDPAHRRCTASGNAT